MLGESPYRRLLGREFESLGAPLRLLHGAALPEGQGHFDVTYSNRLAALLLPLVFGFPLPGRGIPVTVTIARSEKGESWLRTFDRCRLLSEQSAGDGILRERFGAFECDFALRCEETSLHYSQVASRIRAGALVFPLGLFGPTVSASERCEGETVLAEVRIALPLLGSLRYGGILERVRELA